MTIVQFSSSVFVHFNNGVNLIPYESLVHSSVEQPIAEVSLFCLSEFNVDSSSVTLSMLQNSSIMNKSDSAMEHVW